MNNKLAPPALGGPGSSLVVGLSAPWLTWFGRLVPRSIALSHADLAAILAAQCPEGRAVGQVVGDLCLDRLLVSRAHQSRYRRALGVDGARLLVAISSTWGPGSLFAGSLSGLSDLLAGLPPARFSLAVALHPAVWFGHGPRQVMAWLGESRQHGLRVVDPLRWRGLVAAADVLIGDHGSATVYAAATGVPVLRVPPAEDSVRDGSAVATLRTIAPELRCGTPLVQQIDAALTAFHGSSWAAVAARVTSEPTRAASLLRKEMYRLLDLAEPETPAGTAPVPTARLVDGHTWSG
jgi:hypothetical protein